MKSYIADKNIFSRIYFHIQVQVLFVYEKHSPDQFLPLKVCSGVLYIRLGIQWCSDPGARSTELGARYPRPETRRSPQILLLFIIGPLVGCTDMKWWWWWLNWRTMDNFQVKELKAKHHIIFSPFMPRPQGISWSRQFLRSMTNVSDIAGHCGPWNIYSNYTCIIFIIWGIVWEGLGGGNHYNFYFV